MSDPTTIEGLAKLVAGQTGMNEPDVLHWINIHKSNIIGVDSVENLLYWWDEKPFEAITPEILLAYRPIYLFFKSLPPRPKPAPQWELESAQISEPDLCLCVRFRDITGQLPDVLISGGLFSSCNPDHVAHKLEKLARQIREWAEPAEPKPEEPDAQAGAEPEHEYPVVRVEYGVDATCGGDCAFLAYAQDNKDCKCTISRAVVSGGILSPGPRCPGPGRHVVLPEQEYERLKTQGWREGEPPKDGEGKARINL